MRPQRRRYAALLAPVAVVAMAALGLSACGSDGGSGADATSIVVYNAQHEDLVKEMAAGFTKETGIEVQLRNGSDSELANQLAAEGTASPADVFLTENSPGMDLVDSLELFAPVDTGTRKQIPAAYQPKDGDWIGFAARATVLVYNTDQVTDADLPASVMDLADPAWKGKLGIASGGADFQAIASAVVALEGEDKAAEWLAGLKANATVYAGNTALLSAVNAGEVEVGLTYHYYWYQDQAESGANSDNAKLHYFKGEDPGAFVSTSGAGVLKASKRQEAAQKFVAYLTSAAGQKILADSTSLEYPLNPEVPANKVLPPLTDLQAPAVDVAALNGQKVVSLMQAAGLL